jgi:hypothetical protein
MANLSIKTGVISRSMLVGNPAFKPGSFESIATLTATSGQAFLEFSSIPQTYKHLQIRGIAQDTNTGANQAVAGNIRFNGDTASNYAQHELRGDGTSATGQGSAPYGQPLVYNFQWRATSASNIYGVSILDIIDYSSTTKNKVLRYIAGADGNTGTTDSRISLGSALWRSTSALTTIRIIPFTAFTAGSSFALYGIKGD